MTLTLFKGQNTLKTTLIQAKGQKFRQMTLTLANGKSSQKMTATIVKGKSLNKMTVKRNGNMSSTQHCTQKDQTVISLVKWQYGCVRDLYCSSQLIWTNLKDLGPRNLHTNFRWYICDFLCDRKTNIAKMNSNNMNINLNWITPEIGEKDWIQAVGPIGLIIISQ